MDIFSEYAEQTVMGNSLGAEAACFGGTLDWGPQRSDSVPNSTQANLAPFSSSLESASSRHVSETFRGLWKDCSVTAKDQSVFDEHVWRHTQCPKVECLSYFTDEKEKRRHVWTTHRKWAQSINFPMIGGICDHCGGTFTRDDNLLRHKRRKHIP
ncbi:hypothetical protein CORC01_14233 [Colletotrichum orchidophilum]|uniref:C2H2-type domain-containing protein n=1 Tax=Colletotrichum orchidophilum TaxID=1209926 RepID=A0A1G4AMS6_9PEZI|nr:uncharacterized protein CORC01_14233 [Colletotrichum orchidophilum]OHE90467.1 hypothetical protein CORC01_14233 [Colletotrichum orchidophilum]